MIQSLSAVTVAMQSPPPASPGSLVSTVWDMTIRGGWMMIPLAACSLVAMTIVVERLILTRRGRVVPNRLLEALLAVRSDPREATARCMSDPSPLAAIVLAAIRASTMPRPQQEKAIADAGERVMRELRKRMRLLSSLPQVATMLGLLGTVIGMIRTFTVIAASGESLGKTERLAQGIHEAWTATAAGLIIAVPTLLAYHIIMGRLDAAAGALDHAAALWLDEQGGRRSGESLGQDAAPAAGSRGAPIPQGQLAAAV